MCSAQRLADVVDARHPDELDVRVDEESANHLGSPVAAAADHRRLEALHEVAYTTTYGGRTRLACRQTGGDGVAAARARRDLLAHGGQGGRRRGRTCPRARLPSSARAGD